MKIIAKIPENTLPYRCGERLMACTIEEGKLVKCNEFFKSKEEAKKFTEENPEFKWKEER